MASAEPIQLVSTADANQIAYIGVVAASAAANARPDRPIDYHVLYTDAPCPASRALDGYRHGPLRVHLRHVENPYADFGDVAALTPAALLRLALGDLIDAPRVLYLDADVLIRGDLSELHDIDLRGALVAAGRDYPNPFLLDGLHKPEVARLVHDIMGLSARDLEDYVNSGVLVCDLDAFRQTGFARAAFAFVKQHNSQLRFRDQDAFNALLKGKIAFLEPKWNAMMPMLLAKGHFPQLSRSAVCVHFSAEYKPWLRTRNMPFSGEWWHFARQAPTWPMILADYRSMLMRKRRLPNPMVMLDHARTHHRLRVAKPQTR